MKNLFFALLLSVPAVAVAQQGEYTLNGKVGELNAPAKAYLNYTLNGKQMTDTAVITKGAFTFKGMVTEPVKARVIVDHTGGGLSNPSNSADNVILYLEKTKITMSSKDSVKNVSFSGSVINTDCAAFLKSIAVPLSDIKAVNAEYASATSIERQDSEFKNAMRTRFNKANTMIKALQVDFIKSHPNSYFSLIALTEYAQNNQDINTIDSLYEGLSAKVRATTAGQKLLKVIVAGRATAVNSMAPEFIQNDIGGKPVKLSSFRGKYVLLDFWASWCAPCRVENPNVVKAYNMYKDKGFTVVGISLDQPDKKKAWESAVQKDGLVWTQLSDLKFWNNEVAQLYGVKAIPQNFLIDPTGKIIAMNLRGDALEAKLEEVMK